MNELSNKFFVGKYIYYPRDILPQIAYGVGDSEEDVSAEPEWNSLNLLAREILRNTDFDGTYQNIPTTVLNVPYSLLENFTQGVWMYCPLDQKELESLAIELVRESAPKTSFAQFFGEKLRKSKIFFDNHNTYDEVSKKLGAGAWEIRQWELGESIPAKTQLRKISNVLEINYKELKNKYDKNKPIRKST